MPPSDPRFTGAMRLYAVRVVPEVRSANPPRYVSRLGDNWRRPAPSVGWLSGAKITTNESLAKGWVTRANREEQEAAPHEDRKPRTFTLAVFRLVAEEVAP